MSLVDVSLLITIVFFSLYAVACAIECGVAINLLVDKNSVSRRLFTPIWELTNVFLVFGFTIFVVLFNHSLSMLSAALLSTLVVGLFTLLLRACVVLWLFYVSEDTFPLWGRIVFALSNFAIPLSFAAAGVYLLTGQLFWQTWTGWSFMLAVVTGLAANGLLVLNRREKPPIRLSGELMYIIWLMILGSFVPLAIMHDSIYFIDWPITSLVLLAAVGLGLRASKRLYKQRTLFLNYYVLVSFVVPFLLVWANRPYLINGQLTIDQAFGAQTFASAVVVGSLIMLPLIIFGFFIFWKLFKGLPTADQGEKT